MRKILAVLQLSSVVLCSLVPIHAAEAAVQKSTTTRHHYSRGSSGHSGDLGLGAIFGDPTGLTAKYWLTGSTALQFGGAYAIGGYVELLVDHHWAFPQALGDSRFVPYLGVGLAGFFSGDGRYYYNNRYGRYYSRYDGYSSTAFAMRIPLGIEFMPRTIPLGIHVELAPGIGVYPGIFALFQGDVGIKFYF